MSVKENHLPPTHNCTELICNGSEIILLRADAMPITLHPEKILSPFYPAGLPEELLWYRYTDFSVPLSAATSQEYSAILQQLISLISARDDISSAEIAGLLETLLVLLYRSQSTDTHIPRHSNLMSLLTPALSYLDTEYARSCDTAYLAQLCGLSRAQFLNYFQTCLHRTPTQYLRTLRIRKACTALIHTQESILDIALQMGFQSLSGFNHAFRELMGCSPAAYRKKYPATHENRSVQ